MWYLIGMLVVFALLASFTLALARTSTKEGSHLFYDFEDILWGLFICLIVAAIWPLAVVLTIGAYLFIKYAGKQLKDVTNWLEDL